jgi:hypothetical protein
MELIRRDLETLAAAYMRRRINLEIEQLVGDGDEECEWLEARLSLIQGELGKEAYDDAIQEVMIKLDGAFILEGKLRRTEAAAPLKTPEKEGDVPEVARRQSKAKFPALS